MSTRRFDLKAVLTRQITLQQRLWLLSLWGGCLAIYVTYAARADGFTRLDHAIFFRLFAFEDHYAAIAWTTATLIALLVPWFGRVGKWLSVQASTNPGAVIGVAFACFMAGSHLVYLTHPLSMDEYSPVFQAHTFAQGHLTTQYPPELIDRIVVKEFQGFFLMTDPVSGRVASAYWPGLALLMTPLAFFNAEWLLNPALSALALWLIFRISSEIGGRTAGGWALLISLASPQFTVNAFSFYAMPGLLALDLLFVWLIMRGTVRAAFLAGLIGGLALVMHNPVPHAIFALPWLVWLSLNRSRRRQLLAALAGYLPLAIGLGLGWPMAIKVMGLDPGATSSPELGFIEAWSAKLGKIFDWPTYSLLVARAYAAWKIWIWACPALLVLAAFSMRLRGPTPWCKLLWASFFSTFLFYFFFPFDQGHGWGYRYIHSAWGALPICGGVWIARQSEKTRGSDWQARCGALLIAGLAMTPLFLWQTRAVIHESLQARITPPVDGRWVVFITNQPRLYTADLIQNLPGDKHVQRFLSQGHSADERLVVQRFPGARLWMRDLRGSVWALEPSKSK